jgi:hypothetical protein
MSGKCVERTSHKDVVEVDDHSTNEKVGILGVLGVRNDVAAAEHMIDCKNCVSDCRHGIEMSTMTDGRLHCHDEMGGIRTHVPKDLSVNLELLQA